MTQTEQSLGVWPEHPCVADARNERGRDLVVGDLHGHFTTLEHALAALDVRRDRAIACSASGTSSTGAHGRSTRSRG